MVFLSSSAYEKRGKDSKLGLLSMKYECSCATAGCWLNREGWVGQRKECHETNYERWSTPLLLNAAAVQDENAFALLKHIHNKTCSACDTKKRKKAKKADRKEETKKELFTWTARPERRLINNTSHASWYAIFNIDAFCPRLHGWAGAKNDYLST